MNGRDAAIKELVTFFSKHPFRTTPQGSKDDLLLPSKSLKAVRGFPLIVMAPKSYTWISFWFSLTAPLMLWDAGYCLMRPRSMVGGDLHWIWKFYGIYGSVDHVYGVKAYENGDGFAGAAAILNVIEILTNLTYLYQVHISLSDLAPITGYTGAVMTLSKTILYISQEYFCSGCSVGHNDFLVTLLLWITPNLVWITFSSVIIWRLGKDMALSIRKAITVKIE